MGRPRNTEARRAQIVDGMLTVMAEDGYAGASIQAIARAAGLSSGLIHYHFDSKLDILLALLASIAARLQTRYQHRRPDDGDPWASVCAWIDAHLALDDDADPRAVACWVQIGGEALREPQVRDAYQQALQADYEPLLASVRALGGDDASAAAVMSAVQGAFQLSTAAPPIIPPGSAAATVRKMAAGLLGETAA
ncbi:MAG: TetR/AcrR family transcriptional regulator [Myxococcota bacterium]